MINFKPFFTAFLGIALTGCFESQFEACMAQETKAFQSISYPEKWSLENFDQIAFTKNYDVEIDEEDLSELLMSLETLSNISHEEWNSLDAIDNKILIDNGWEVGDWWGNPAGEFEFTEQIISLLNKAHDNSPTKHIKLAQDKFLEVAAKEMFWDIVDEIGDEEAKLMANSNVPFDSVKSFTAVLDHFEKYVFPPPQSPHDLARELCNSRGLYK